MKKNFIQFFAKILLAGITSGVMYCLWKDAVSPRGSAISGFFVVVEFILFCLNLLLIYHLAFSRSKTDALFPPLIASVFAANFWSGPETSFFIGSIIFFFISFLVYKTDILRKTFQSFKQAFYFRKGKIIGASVFLFLFVVFGVCFFAQKMLPSSLLFMLEILFFLGVALLSLFFLFYPLFLCWFFRESRSVVLWIFFLLYSVVWSIWFWQTAAIKEWRMQTFVDPCYIEEMSGKQPEYDILLDQVCVLLPTDNGSFNLSVRKTLEGADPSSFQQIANSVYYRDRAHVYYGDKVLSSEPDSVFGSEKFLLDGDKLFAYGELVDINKDTKVFHPDDKSFELQYLGSLFTKQEGDFPIRTVSQGCETEKYLWNAYRFGYHAAVMTTNKGCVFQPLENEIFVEKKSMSGISGKLYHSEFDMVWFGEACGRAYKVIYPKDWNEFFLPQLSIQKSCQKK